MKCEMPLIKPHILLQQRPSVVSLVLLLHTEVPIESTCDMIAGTGGEGGDGGFGG